MNIALPQLFPIYNLMYPRLLHCEDVPNVCLGQYICLGLETPR